MKATKFSVINSTVLDEETMIVNMAMGNPQPNQKFGLELKLHNEKWMVVGNAQ